MPDLGVVGHHVDQFRRGRWGVLLPIVGSVGGVIDKAEHMESNIKGSIWRGKLSSMGFESMAVEEGARNEKPVDGRIATALAGTIDWKGFAVLNVSVGYP